MVCLALGVDGVGEGQVGVVEHGENIVGIFGQFSRHGQQPFLCRREDVGTTAANFIQMPAIALQSRNLLVELLQLLVRNGQDLIGLKGGGGVELGHEVGQLSAHLLWLGGPGVLVRPAEGVDRQMLEDEAHLVPQLEPVVEQLSALPQTTLVALYKFQIILVPLKILMPFGVAAVEIGQRPSVGEIHIFAFGNRHRSSSLFDIGSIIALCGGEITTKVALLNRVQATLRSPFRENPRRGLTFVTRFSQNRLVNPTATPSTWTLPL